MRPDLALAKEDLSPVTVADLTSQYLIVQAIRENFPQDRVLGEENFAPLRDNPLLIDQVLRAVQAVGAEGDAQGLEAVLNSASYQGGPEEPFWTLDPIDGTKGYLRGGQYAIALAWLEKGEPTLGVLGCPNLQTMDDENGETGRGAVFCAVRGEGVTESEMAQDGALREPSELARHSGSTPFPDARMVESVEGGHADHEMHQKICRELGVNQSSVRIDSQCKYAALARGEAHIYLRLPSKPGYVEKIWDHAAGWLLVQETGGAVTDALGQPLDFAQGMRLEKNRGVVASRGVDHAQLIAAVRDVMD